MKRRSIGPSVSFFAFQDIITAVVGIFILITLILVLELTQRVEAATSKPTVNVEQIQETLASLQGEIQRLNDDFRKRREFQESTSGVNAFNREARIDELKAEILAAEESTNATESQMRKLAANLKDEQRLEDKLLLQAKELEDDRDEISQLTQVLDEIAHKQQQLQSADGMIYRDMTESGLFVCLVTVDGTSIDIRDAASKSTQHFAGSNRVEQFGDWLRATDRQQRHFLLMIRPSGVDVFDEMRTKFTDLGCVFGFDVTSKDDDVRLGFEFGSEP